MNIYRQDFTLLSCDVDMNRSLRLSALFQKLQEAAIAHTIRLGVTREKTLDRGLLWAVTQYRLRIRRLPVYDEKVTLLTWPGKTMHLYFPRYFRLVDAAGRVLIDAASLWVLIDEKTRGIVFPEEHDIYIKEVVTGSELPLPGRLRKVESETVSSFTVPYSCVDLNGHMNNARYYDLALDLMPASLRSRRLCGLVSEHIGEAQLDDVLTVKCSASEDAFCISGEKDRPVFRMKFELDRS